MSNSPPPGARDGPPASGRPGAPPPGQIVDWLKFAWASLSQVRGFVPKMKALSHIISVLTKR